MLEENVLVDLVSCESWQGCRSVWRTASISCIIKSEMIPLKSFHITFDRHSIPHFATSIQCSPCYKVRIESRLPCNTFNSYSIQNITRTSPWAVFCTSKVSFTYNEPPTLLGTNFSWRLVPACTQNSPSCSMLLPFRGPQLGQHSNIPRDEATCSGVETDQDLCLPGSSNQWTLGFSTWEGPLNPEAGGQINVYDKDCNRLICYQIASGQCSKDADEHPITINVGSHGLRSNIEVTAANCFPSGIIFSYGGDWIEGPDTYGSPSSCFSELDSHGLTGGRA